MARRGDTQKIKTMKNKFIITILALFALAFTASAQVYPNNLFTATNLPAIMSNGSISNAQASPYIIEQHAGVAFTWQFNVSSNAATGNAGLFIYPSADGTNYSLAPIAVLVAPALGGTNQTVTTNLSPAQLSGYLKLNIGAVTNGQNGTLTNKVLLFNRWNRP